MPEFAYEALDRTGRAVRGEEEADSADRVIETLRARGLSPVEVKEKKARGGALFGGGLRKARLARMVRQLATLINAGVGLLDAVQSFNRSGEDAEITRRARQVAKALRAGSSLSSSLEKAFPELPAYAPRLVELGEATGRLGPALNDVAERMDYELRLTEETRSALAYPTFLGVVGVGIILFMFLFVVPRFATLVEQARSEPPLISQIVIGVSVWLNENWALGLGLFVVAVIGVAALIRATKGGARGVLERMPIVGGYLLRAELAGWARTMGVALDNGAGLLRAMELAGKGARSETFRAALQEAQRKVRAGQPLDEALQQSLPAIDPMAVDLIRTGRSSGALSEMLVFAADLYEQEAKARAKRLTALAEPAAVLLISLVVGVIVLSIVLAMTSIYEFEV